MKLKRILLASVLALGFAGIATAGGPTDADGDLVPDSIDNCLLTPNGPNEGALNQLDGDLDGYGNACDADYNNDGVVDAPDWYIFPTGFGGGNSVIIIDLNGDGVVNGLDLGPFVVMFNTLPGPSGLSCAGTVPCTP